MVLSVRRLKHSVLLLSFDTSSYQKNITLKSPYFVNKILTLVAWILKGKLFMYLISYFFNPQLQEPCGYRQGRLKMILRKVWPSAEILKVLKQNTLLCVVFRSKQHLMIPRVILVIFIPLRLEGSLLFCLLPKGLPNTDLVVMSGTYMRHYYQQGV